MQIVISSAHGAKVPGASGVIEENSESQRVVSQVTLILREMSIGVVEFHESVATNQRDNVGRIIGYHNGQIRDLDVSVHFNATSGGIVDRPIGTEVLYATAEDLASRVSRAISNASGLINRGAKSRKDLSFLTRTSKPAIMLEICFVNSREDVRLYRANFHKICIAISEAISGKKRVGGELK